MQPAATGGIGERRAGHEPKNSLMKRKHSAELKTTLIVIYLAVAFIGYFVSLFVSRLTRIRDFLGL